MKVIKPSTMSLSLLVSENVSEIYSEWSAATTYALGAKVVRNNLGVYESLIASNINHAPEALGTYWTRVGPTNTMAMFDSQISTSTVSTTNITATVKVGSIDTIALLNVVGSEVTLTIRNSLGGTIVYGPVTKSLQGDNPIDWYDYFYFDTTDQRTQAIFLDLPAGITDAHATFEVSAASGSAVSIGSFIFGNSVTIGSAEYGISAGITDYSTKETDEYGTTEFIIREFSKRVTVDLQIENTSLNKIQRVLYGLRATPALWICTDDARYEEATIVFGFYRDFTTTIPYPTISKCSLEIEGLI
jgi:hypothetical protein